VKISVLQIAYYSTLLQTRQQMLENDGYKVVSALGNDQAMAFASTEPFDVAVVGFSANYPVRKQMVRWLKQHLPHLPVVALLANAHEKFPEADCTAVSENPRSWLAAVSDCVQKS
jgi:DNA-binding NtrC family response regulator